MKQFLTAIFLLVVAGWYFGLGGCLFMSGRNELRFASMDDYLKSDVAKWIAVPAASADIATYRFLGFDTNYRYLMATVQPESIDLAELCSRSIALQSGETNASIAICTNINVSGFDAVFGGPPRSRPSWWITDASRFDRQYLCAWENTNHYGYGYIFLVDSKKSELRAFQWIQQWNTVARTKQAFENEVEQAGPGHPSQDAGSPAP